MLSLTSSGLRRLFFVFVMVLRCPESWFLAVRSWFGDHFDDFDVRQRVVPPFKNLKVRPRTKSTAKDVYSELDTT